MPFFIVNPRSAGGQTGRAWDAVIRPRIVRRFPDARWALTERAGQAVTLARLAVREAFDLVVAVGGDGTVNEVVNGLALETVGDPGHGGHQPVLGIVPRGTGCDFVKSAGVPKDLDLALEVLAGGRTIDADVCEICFTSEDGGPLRRLSLNQCGCGASGEVARRVNQASGPQHGFVAFLLATLQVAITYRPQPSVIAIDDDPVRRVDLKTLFVCNGQYCGGGMRTGRGALINDGLLRVVEVNAVSPVRALLQGYRLYTGRLDGVRGVRVYDARSIRVGSPGMVRVDCDGEQPGRLPATYTVRPHAVRLRVGASGPAIGAAFF